MMCSPLELEGLKALEAFHKVALSTLDTEAENQKPFSLFSDILSSQPTLVSLMGIHLVCSS